MYPAGEPGVSVRYVTLHDGMVIRVIESGPATGEVVLLVHGWGGLVYSYAETIPALANAGYRAIALDLPGHGLSDKPLDASKYTTRALNDVILGVADAMNVRRFTFVGHSMGGALGLDLATRGDQRLTRLVLINPAGMGAVPIMAPLKLLSPPIVNRVVPMLLGRAVISAVLHAAFATPRRPTEQDIDEYWAPTQFDEFAWSCRACLHKVTWRRVPATKLRSLRMPVLVFVSGHDRILRGVAKRAKLIPTARIVPIPEGGHLVMQECDAKTNAQLLVFLRETRRAPNS
jgi:pimeloyl-ACP methyl ester carboxylesterase